MSVPNLRLASEKMIRLAKSTYLSFIDLGQVFDNVELNPRFDALQIIIKIYYKAEKHVRTM